MEAGDWRSELQPDLRRVIFNEITDMLKRCLSFSGEEGLPELEKIAVRFEEKIYVAASSEEDYRRKIILKMLTIMDTKSQNAVSATPPSNLKRRRILP